MLTVILAIVNTVLALLRMIAKPVRVLWRRIAKRETKKHLRQTIAELQQQIAELQKQLEDKEELQFEDGVFRSRKTGERYCPGCLDGEAKRRVHLVVLGTSSTLRCPQCKERYNALSPNRDIAPAPQDKAITEYDVTGLD